MDKIIKMLISKYCCNIADLGEWHTESSALALLDGTVYWDMHRPLTESCTLEVNLTTICSDYYH